MAEYIERKATCKDCFHYCVCKDTVADENWEEDAPKEVREMFSPRGCKNYVLAADVVKVVHGEWIEYHGQSYLVHPMKYDEYGCPILQDYVGYKCSECGRAESKKEPYCNCGAKMDGGKE